MTRNSSLRFLRIDMTLATTLLKVLLSCVVFAGLGFAQGPCGPSVLGTAVGIYGPGVHAATVFDDGNGTALYAGGDFADINGVAASNVARWDGVNWSPLGSGVDGTVRAMEVFDDGTGPALFVGGSITVAGGVPASGIAKWDGTSWSALGAGISGYSVLALTVFDDGVGEALFVGGTFSGAGGTAASGVARWSGGTGWSPVGAGFSGSVQALTVFDDGTGPALYAGGAGVARWDGANWSGLGNVPLSYVRALTCHVDSAGPALYAGGSPQTTYSLGVVKWQGGAWSSLPVLPIGFEQVSALAVFDDGSGNGPQVYAGGQTTGWNGPGTPRAAAWNGAQWVSSSLAYLGAGVTCWSVFDDGTGPKLCAGLSGEWVPGSTWPYYIPASNAPGGVEAILCSTTSVSTLQPGPGAPVSVVNANLTPGREYYNLVSIDPCPGGPGTGPGPFGSCLSPQGLQFLTQQLQMPVGTGPFHFIAPSSYVAWPAMTGLPPITVDAICIDVTGGTVGPVSPVVRITVQ